MSRTIGIVPVASLAARTAGERVRHDNVYLESNQFRGQRREALAAAGGPPVFDREVLSLHVAVLAQPSDESDQDRIPGEGGLPPRYPTRKILWGWPAAADGMARRPRAREAAIEARMNIVLSPPGASPSTAAILRRLSTLRSLMCRLSMTLKSSSAAGSRVPFSTSG